MNHRSGNRGRGFLVLLVSLLSGIVSSHGYALADMGEDYVPNEVLVKFKAGQAAMAQGFHAQIGAKVAASLAVSKVSRVMLPQGVTVSEALRLYSANPSVEFAEPNYILHFADTIPNDPEFSNQWGHRNTGQLGGTPDADIDSVEAWDTSVGSDSIVVALTDTGIDLTHPDLVANIWTNPGEEPWADPYDPTTGNGVDDDLNGYVDDWKGYDFNGALPLIPFHDNDPSDGVGHGTHCAGILAARGNNGIGVTGVSWNAKIMPLKIGPDSGLTLTVFVAAQAIDYAVANGADIICASWGGLAGISTVRTAIENALSAGVLFVAAAGNFGTNNDGFPKFYPASYDLDNIIAVAATDDDDELADFSNFGRTTVDVGAPGVGILSTMPTYEVFLTEDPYSYSTNYDYLNGTSMATPFVAGALAVLMSAYPTETHLEIRDRLFSGVDQVPGLDGLTVTGGRINLNNSITGSYPDLPDDDQDDVANWIDNCRFTYNPGQEDQDGDGIGDACESQYSAVTNAEAAAYGSSSLAGSGIANSLALLLVPIGAVIVLRFRRGMF